MQDVKNNPEYVPGHGLLKGKSVLITAAAGVGIGFAAAKKSVEEGCRAIVISDIHEGRLQASVDKLKEETGLQNVWGKVCNVVVEEEVQELIAFAEEKLGGVDVLINNAGMGTSKLLIEMEDPEWNKVIDVTLNGTMRMTRHMMKVMKPRGTADFGVRINAVAPSLAVHPMLKKSAPEELLKELEGKEAFGRGAEVWEVANVMMFLASDYSSYMTGEILAVSAQRA